MPPAIRPARAPARERFVGAAWRTAQMTAANGTRVMMGIERRHASHWSPTFIGSERELGAEKRLLAAKSMILTNGKTMSVIGVSAPPGREALFNARKASAT